MIKSIATVVGAAIAGPAGALIGTLSSSLLSAILPGIPEPIQGLEEEILKNIATDQGKKFLARLDAKEKRLVNHDLQVAFREAFIEAVYDIGGRECFPQIWRTRSRVIPTAVIYPQSTGQALWGGAKPEMSQDGYPSLKNQVCGCLQGLVQAVRDDHVLPLSPPAEVPAGNAQTYLASNTPEQFNEVFFGTVLAPYINNYRSLMLEQPDFLQHLKRHLLDRTLVYLGENLKQRTPAWRAYNRLVLEQTRSQLAELGQGQAELSTRIDSLLEQFDIPASGQLMDGLADLLSAVGGVDKKMDEQLASIMERVLNQHRELMQSLESISKTSLSIESKVDRVLRILEDGQFVVEGSPPVAMDIPPEPGEAPFQGMQFFDERDAERFFGREKLVAKLAGRLCNSCFLAVVGASGSGKSSLVRAGLLTALRSGKPLIDGTLPPDGCRVWQIHLITPGEHPLESLAVSLINGKDSLQVAAKLHEDMLKEPRTLSLAARRLILGKSSRQKILLVVDQFEELFTLCRDENERQAFIDNLVQVVSGKNTGCLKAVITLRADFYDECGRYPKLRTLLQDCQEYIGPMAGEELRRAIEEPARLGNWQFERGLVDLILRDVGEEPGALPLLSHALLETWKHRRGRMMTLESYAEAGGVSGAIAQTAETVFYKRLSPVQQAIARSIFLRLTELGEGTQDTRRRVALDELVPEEGKQAELDIVLAALVDARLVTTSEDSAEVAHEALIREWPLLRGWLSENRDSLRVAMGVRQAAREWQQGHMDTSLLVHRGSRLDDVLSLAKEGGFAFNPVEIEYLQACRRLVEGERRARERLRSRLLAASLAGALVMLALSIWGLNRAGEADNQLRVANARGTEAAQQAENANSMAGTAEAERIRAEGQAATAVAERDRAEEARRFTRSHELALEAGNSLTESPSRSVLLAIEALKYSTTQLSFAQDSLREVLSYLKNGLILSWHEGSTHTMSFSPDGSWLVIGNYSGSVWLWDMDNIIAGPIVINCYGSVISLAFTPDGRWLGTGSGNNGVIELWDMQDPTADPLVLSGHNGFIKTLSFSPDGRWLATGSADKSARLWNMQDLTAEPIMLWGHDDVVYTLAFSPDGHWFATGSWDKTARLWNMQDLNADPVVLKGHEDDIYPLAFSPEGRWLATGSWDHTTRLWDMQDLNADPLVLRGHESVIYNLAFSPDGGFLVTGSWDGTARLWDMQDLSADPVLLPVDEDNSNEFGLAFSPDGRFLATGSGVVDKLWELGNLSIDPVILSGYESWINLLAFSPNGSWLATGGGDNTARLWNMQNLTTDPVILSGHEIWISALTFSPDGRWLVTGSGDNNARLWDMQDLTTDPVVLRGHEDFIYALTFSLDGRWLVTGGADNTARLWDMQNLTTDPVVLRGHEDYITMLVFSSDGRWLVTGSVDNTAQLWDMQDLTTDPIVLRGHEGNIDTLAFSSDGRWLATGSDDYVVRLWDMQDLTSDPVLLKGYDSAFSPRNFLAFNPDGHWLATGSGDNTTWMWDMQNLTADPVVLWGHDDNITSRKFNPDGHWLATSSTDKTARLWDIRDMTADPVVLKGHEGGIYALAFSPDGHWLATGGDDNTVRLWDINLDSLVEKACRMTRSNFSQEEWIRYFPGEEYRLTCPQYPAGQ